MAELTAKTTQDFEVTKAREIGGVYRAVGEIISLTLSQAKYYLAPHGAGLKRVAKHADPDRYLDEPTTDSSTEQVTGRIAKPKG